MSVTQSGKSGAKNSEEYRYPQGILATCCIPWREDFTLDEPLLRATLQGILKQTPMIYLFGTAGEGYALSREQFRHIVSIFAAEMASADADPMVGIITLSLSEMKYRIAAAMELGVRSFQISLPSWDTLTPAETGIFFDEILGTFPEADFFHYNSTRAGRTVTPTEYAEISARHPNLVGAKITTDSTRYIEAIMNQKLPIRLFFTSPGYAYASQFGTCGFLIAIASCNWNQARRYFAAGMTGERELLLKLQGELGAMTGELLAAVGISGHIDGAYDKMFLKMHNPDFPLRLLPPYGYPPESAYVRFREYIVSHYPSWLPEGH